MPKLSAQAEYQIVPLERDARIPLLSFGDDTPASKTVSSLPSDSRPEVTRGDEVARRPPGSRHVLLDGDSANSAEGSKVTRILGCDHPTGI